MSPCPIEEQVLVQNVQINSGTKAKDLVKILIEAGETLSLSPMKLVSSQHDFKVHSERRNTLFQKKQKKARLQFANPHKRHPDEIHKQTALAHFNAAAADTAFTLFIQ